MESFSKLIFVFVLLSHLKNCVVFSAEQDFQIKQPRFLKEKNDLADIFKGKSSLIQNVDQKQEEVSKISFKVDGSNENVQGVDKISRKLHQQKNEENKQKENKNDKNIFQRKTILPQELRQKITTNLRNEKNSEKNEKQKVDRKTLDISADIQNILRETETTQPIIIINQQKKEQGIEQEELKKGEQENSTDQNNLQAVNEIPAEKLDLIKALDSSEEFKFEKLNLNQPNIPIFSEPTQQSEMDPYYVQHPIYYNPIDKFGVKKKFMLQLQKKTEDKITISDIDTLMDVLNFIGQLYSQLFNEIPENKTDKEKGTLEKTLEILRYYSKIRQFLVLVLNKREDLIKDINFLNGKVNLLKFTRQDMINFYNQQDRFFKVELKEISYASDPRMKSYQKDIQNMTEEFGKDAKIVIQFAFNLSKFTAMFLDEIYKLQSTEYNSTAMKVLGTFDQIIMLTIRILENKVNILSSIHNLKNGLANLKTRKMALEETIYNVENLEVTYVQNTPKVELKGGFLPKPLFVVITIFGFLIW